MTPDWSTRTTLMLIGALALALAAGLLMLDAILAAPQPVLRVLAALLVGVTVACLAGLRRGRQAAGAETSAACAGDAVSGSRSRRMASSNTTSS